MQAWKVMLKGVWVETVFFVPSMTAQDVKRALVDHDGFNPEIEVVAD